MDIECQFDYKYNEQGTVEVYTEEESRGAGVIDSIQKLEQGAQFSFYDLGLSEDDSEILSHIEISQYENVVIYLSEIELSETNNLNGQLDNHLKNHIVEVTRKLKLIPVSTNYINDIDYFANLITKQINNVLSATNHKDAEIVLRTRTEYDSEENNNCIYWHIDKSHGEIRKSEANNSNFSHPIGTKERQEIFIISLLGEPTIFQHINSQQRDEFFNFANETRFFYGHSSIESCIAQDGIDGLFHYKNSISSENGYGSVHIMGKTGTIHAAPPRSSARMLLLITPIG